MQQEIFKPFLNEHTEFEYVQGYQKCLQDIALYLERTTEFKPEKRYIDAIPINEAIAYTLGDILKTLNHISNKLHETKNQHQHA